MQQLNIHGVNDVRLDQADVPKPGPRDIVIGVKCCGICGSDLTYIKIGGIPPGRVTPIGHEAAGEIIALGAEVEGLSLGQRVVVNPMTTPSYVGSGGPEGAFTQQLLVRDAKADVNIYEIPEGLPYELAAMTEPLSVALHGVNRMEVSPGDKVAVFGCGPIGLGMIMWLADRGLSDVVALDLSPVRLERALKLGASHVINPAKEDVREKLLELHGSSKLFSRESVGTDAYIDAAGAPNLVSDIVRMAKFQSRFVVTAAHMKPVELDLMAMLTTEMTITTAVGYPTEMPEVLAAIPRLRDKVASMITHRFDFADVLAGIEQSRDPSSTKVMVEISQVS